MYFLIFLTVINITYIVTFKDNFREEHINKVKPVLIGFVAVVFILCILNSILSN